MSGPVVKAGIMAVLAVAVPSSRLGHSTHKKKDNGGFV